MGLCLEVLGYAGRIMMHFNPFLKSNFLLYLIDLTIAPVFMAAGVYLCLARIVMVYGEELSWIKARSYTLIFCCCDFFSLVLVALGGGIAAEAMTKPKVCISFFIISRFVIFQGENEVATDEKIDPPWNTYHGRWSLGASPLPPLVHDVKS
jgi:hypothetical protein